MVDYLHKPVAHEAFFKKYASKKFLKGDLYLFVTQGLLLNLIHSFNTYPSMGQEVPFTIHQYAISSRRKGLSIASSTTFDKTIDGTSCQ